MRLAREVGKGRVSPRPVDPVPVIFRRGVASPFSAMCR